MGFHILVATLYLRQWKRAQSQGSSWKFQKLKQVWLIEHFDEVTTPLIVKYFHFLHQIPKSDFKIFINYIERMQGAARQVPLEKVARNLIHVVVEVSG